MARFVAVNWRDLKNPEAGGAEVHLHEILRHLVANGHEVTYFVSRFAGGAEEEEHDGIRVIRKGQWFNANFVIPYHVRRFLRDNPADLVLEDINKIPFFLPKAVPTPVVPIVPHLFGATVFRETNPLFATYVYSWERLIPLVYAKCRFVVISPSTKDDLVARGIPADRIDVVLCGLDHDTYRVIEGVDRFERPTIIHFGRIRKYKSIDVVIDAFAIVRKQLPEARLVIVGGGPDANRLIDYARRLGLDNDVEFSGTLATPDLVRLLNRAHLFLNASPKEGWGLTVVEANACGMPVVASRRPGLQDSVKDGKTGYLVEYGDSRAFARRAMELLTDGALWDRMSDNAKEWARSLTWERTGREMKDIFLDEIGRRGGDGR